MPKHRDSLAGRQSVASFLRFAGVPSMSTTTSRTAAGKAAASAADAASRRSATPWRAISAGLCATLVGIGLARFAYTPLLPAIIDAHWFSASAATYLGAA